jgi:hypothetical protein
MTGRIRARSEAHGKTACAASGLFVACIQSYGALSLRWFGLFLLQ